MVADVAVYELADIVGVRCRRGLFGRLVLQVQRRRLREVMPAPGQEWSYRDEGCGPWRDANGNDPSEMAELAAILSNAGLPLQPEVMTPKELVRRLKRGERWVPADQPERMRERSRIVSRQLAAPASKAKSPEWYQGMVGGPTYADVLGWRCEVEESDFNPGEWVAHVRCGDSDDWQEIARSPSQKDTMDAADSWFVRQAMTWAGLDLRSAAERASALEQPLPMGIAPRDGTMLRLLVRFTEHATDDAEEAWTIGSNSFEANGDDKWQFAGWCWTHDHFTDGEGTPVGWLPMLDATSVQRVERS